MRRRGAVKESVGQPCASLADPSGRSHHRDDHRGHAGQPGAAYTDSLCRSALAQSRPQGKIYAAYSKGVEVVIREAIKRGEFDRLPGAGKRIHSKAYFEMPQELGLAGSMLRNAGVFSTGGGVGAADPRPEEQAKLVANDHERPAVARRLRDMHIRLGVLTDGMMHNRHAK